MLFYKIAAVVCMEYVNLYGKYSQLNGYVKWMEMETFKVKVPPSEMCCISKAQL